MTAGSIGRSMRLLSSGQRFVSWNFDKRRAAFLGGGGGGGGLLSYLAG